MGGPLLISDDLTRTGRLARSLGPARRCTVHDLYDDIAPAELPDLIVGDVAGLTSEPLRAIGAPFLFLT